MADSLPRMKRDGALPALAALLLLAALPAAGLASVALLPQSPKAYYALALVCCLVFFLGVVPVRLRTLLRAGTLALGALPFLFFAVLEGGSGWSGPVLPAAGWITALVLAGITGFLGPRRQVLSGALVVWLGGGAVLAAADMPLLPARWNPADSPVRKTAADDRNGPLHADASESGVRAAGPVRLEPGRQPALGEGPGPWWVRAGRGRFEGPRPVILVVDGAAGPTNVPPRPAGMEMTVVPGREHPFRHALDLTAFDVLLVREGSWREDDPFAAEKAAAVAGFVRGGGLLIGPAPERDWPPRLGRLLRGAGRARDRGVAGVRQFGLGRVARASMSADAEALLAARLWVAEAGTSLARALPPPAAPSGWDPWRDDRAARRIQGLLLIAYTVALAAFAWLVRARAARCLVVLLASLAVCAGLVWLSPREPGFRARGLALELGGRGGRRYEAVLISAGPAGFDRPVRWAGGGIVSVHGGRLTEEGNVRIGPGRRAWVVRETSGVGAQPGDVEDRAAAILRPLLVGEIASERLRYGRVEALPIRIPGLGAVPAATLLYRAPPP